LSCLITTTSPQQKRGIADYFAPASVSESTSGSGGILGGTSLGDQGAKSDGSQPGTQKMPPKPPPKAEDAGKAQKSGAAGGPGSSAAAAAEAAKEAAEKRETDD